MSILSTSGAITKLTSPLPNVKNGKKEHNKKIFLFQERENFRLPSDVNVDISLPRYYAAVNSLTPDIISAGTPVDSYFLHFDVKGTSDYGIRREGSVTFDEKILGVIVRQENHESTWSILGNPGTQYAINKANTELNDRDKITWEGNRLDVSLITFANIDQVRVITKHCVPPTLTSLLLNGRNSNITISEGNSVSARLEATDPNRDTIDFFLDGRNIGTDDGEPGTRSERSERSESTSLAFPDNGTFTYRAQAKDEDGKYSNTITRTVTVNNVAPTLTGFNLSSNFINEGQSAQAYLYATDPGADSISFSIDGRFISTDFRTSGTRSASNSLSYEDDGTFSVIARAQDDDNALSNTRTQTLTVNNVAPTLTDIELSRNVINEGQSVEVQMSATDPGADGISFYLDGSFISTDTRRSGTRSASTSLDPFQDDGIFTFTHSAQAQDDDGAFSNVIRKTQTLTVNNVAPTINFTLSNNVIDEGQSVEVQMSATDPGADTISFSIDGNVISTDTRTSGTREASTSLSYEDDGTFFIIAQARDDDDASHRIQKSLTVNNVDPTITSLTEDLSISTNNTFSFAGAATDPGLTDILVYEWDFDGDGIFDDFTGSSGEWSFSEPGDHEVKLRVSDGDGGVDEDTFTVTAVEPKLPEPYSFRFTDIKAVSDDPEGDKFQFSFEVINWTDTPAAGIKIALNEATNFVKIGEKYPEFAGATVDENGRPLGPNRDPVTGNLNIPNNGTVLASDKTAISWKTGDPIVNRDLLGAISTEEAIALVPGSELISGEPHISDIEAVDNGDNVRDGFVFTVDHINELEILSFDMSLLDENGNSINSASDSYNYGSGVVTIFRRSHKEVTNPDALFINTSVNHPEGTGIPNEPEELFYNNVNRVTEFV